MLAGDEHYAWCPSTQSSSQKTFPLQLSFQFYATCVIYYNIIACLKHFWNTIWHNSPVFIICPGSLSLFSHTSSGIMSLRIKIWPQHGYIIRLCRTEMLSENKKDRLIQSVSIVQDPSYPMPFNQKNKITFSDAFQLLIPWQTCEQGVYCLQIPYFVKWTCIKGMTLQMHTFDMRMNPQYTWHLKLNVRVPDSTSGNKDCVKLFHSPLFYLLLLKVQSFQTHIYPAQPHAPSLTHLTSHCLDE